MHMADPTTTTEPQNNEFTAILHQARDVDGAADEIVSGPKPEQAQVTEVLDPVAAWAEIPAAIGGLLAMAAPELQPVYNEKACRAWGEAMHRLAVKRGWSTEGMPPEVSVALVTLGFAVPTVAVIKVKRAQAQAAARAKAQPSGESGFSQEITGTGDGAAAGA